MKILQRVARRIQNLDTMCANDPTIPLAFADALSIDNKDIIRLRINVCIHYLGEF